MLAGVLASAILVGGAGFLLGRETAEPKQVVTAPPAAKPSPTPTPASAPALPSVLGRADIIALANAAADAGVGGAPAGKVATLDGRRFELRLPFGCHGAAREGSNAAMRWRYDAQSQALRIHVRPVSWTAADWWADGEAAGMEAVEGFWIRRPWTSSEACPAAGARPAALGIDPVMLPGQTLAVGQVFYAEGARGGKRNGEPYETVIRVPEDQLDTSSGFRLRISGRIARAADARTVRCRQPAGAEQRPICLVSVVIDEVGIENPASGKTLAVWSLGAQGEAGRVRG